MFAQFGVVSRTSLEMKHACHDLQTILDPMIDLLEQDLVAFQCGLKVALLSLPLDRHAEDIGCSLEERDVIFTKFAFGSAIDFQDTVRRVFTLEDDVHRPPNAVFN